MKDCKEGKENKDGELFNDTVVTEERKGSLNASSPKGKIKLDPSAFKVTGLIPPKPLPIRRDPYEVKLLFLDISQQILILIFYLLFLGILYAYILMC